MSKKICWLHVYSGNSDSLVMMVVCSWGGIETIVRLDVASAANVSFVSNDIFGFWKTEFKLSVSKIFVKKVFVFKKNVVSYFENRLFLKSKNLEDVITSLWTKRLFVLFVQHNKNQDLFLCPLYWLTKKRAITRKNITDIFKRSRYILYCTLE